MRGENSKVYDDHEGQQTTQAFNSRGNGSFNRAKLVVHTAATTRGGSKNQTANRGQSAVTVPLQRFVVFISISSKT